MSERLNQAARCIGVQPSSLCTLILKPALAKKETASNLKDLAGVRNFTYNPNLAKV